MGIKHIARLNIAVFPERQILNKYSIHFPDAKTGKMHVIEHNVCRLGLSKK